MSRVNEILQRGLETVGLPSDFSCDPQRALQELQTKYKDYEKDVKDTVNSLSARSFGTFLTTVAALLAQVTAGVGLFILDGLIIQGIFGNILGTITLFVGMTLASFTGIYIMLIYLATRQLKKSLEERIKMGTFLEREITQMIAFFKSIAQTVEQGKKENVDEVLRALRHVRAASVIVGSETAKTQKSGKLLNGLRLERARDELDKAVNELTTKGFISIQKELSELHKSYSLSVDTSFFSATVPDPQLIINYFSALNDEIDRVYFSDDLTENQLKLNEDKVRLFYLNLVKMLPRFVRNIAYIKFFEQRGEKLFKYIPVEAKVFKDITESINNSTRIPDNVLRFFNVSVPNRQEKTISIDKTYVRIVGEVKLSEVAVLNLTEYLEKVEFEAGIFKSLLVPANKKLKRIRSEMEDFSTKTPESPGRVVEISTQKLKWSTELLSVKGNLLAATGPGLKFNGQKTYPTDDLRRFNKAEKDFERLKEFIRNKEDKSGDVYLIAQATLSSLALGNVSLLAPGFTKNVLTGLQAIRTILRDQIKLDKQEIIMCNNVLHELEGSVFFRNVIKPGWEELKNSILSSPAAKSVVGDLEKGDLGTLVNSLEGIQKIGIIASALKCGEGLPERKDELSTVLGAQFDVEGKENFKQWYENYRREAIQAINTLQDRKTKLDIIKNQLTD